MIPAKHFYMIRHGQSEANASRIMAGRLDSPLTTLGRQQATQARLVVEQLKVKPSAIIHSNLSRARETAEIINQSLRLPMTQDPEFAEMFVGEFEGRPWEECDFFDDWADPPGGETAQGFFERIRNAKKKTLENFDGPVLIVCHGGVFRALWKLYGHDMPGVENCHLHEFFPAPEPKSFPWHAHVYDYDESLIRTLSKHQPAE